MNRVAQLRTSFGPQMTQEAFGEKCGLSRSSIARYESGENVSSVAAKKIAKACNVSRSYVLGDEYSMEDVRSSIPITTHRIPLLGTIHCGEPTFAEEAFEAYVEVGAKIKADFALRARGDSMIGARIHDGDIIFIHQQDTVADGEIAAILLDDEAALKRVRYIPGGMVSLHAENPKYPPIYIGGENETRTVRILGKAVAFQSDVR